MSVIFHYLPSEVVRLTLIGCLAVASNTAQADSLCDRSAVGQQWEVAGRAMNSLAFARDGRVGMLIADSTSKWEPAPVNGSAERKRLLFVERSASGARSRPQQVVCFREWGTPFSEAALFYNSGGIPEVYLAQMGHIIRLVRIGKAWSEQESVSAPPKLLPEQDWYSFKTSAAAQGHDGSVHFAMYAQGPGDVRLLHARRSASGQWTWQVAATAEGQLSNLEAFEWVDFRHYDEPRNLSIAVDNDGKAHIVYSWKRRIKPIGGGSEVRSSLLYATNTGRRWTSVTLLTPGSGYGDAGLGASVASAPDGTVAVAASWIPRARTGSPGRAELRYLVKTRGGQWKSTVVASSADGYQAGDGPRGTGLFPRLVFDRASLPHIVFTDHASQHFPGIGAKSFSGQVRYATSSRSGNWSVRTILSRGTVPAEDFQTYDVDIAAGSGVVIVAATHYVWDKSRSAYLKKYFASSP